MINFERYLKELLYDEDFLIIPGLGAFIAQFTKPELLDSGEITPAKKTFEFNSFLNTDEEQKLISAVTQKEGKSKATIEAELNEFLYRLKSTLNTNKKVVLCDVCSFSKNEDGTLIGEFDKSINFLEKPDFMEDVDLRNNQALIPPAKTLSNAPIVQETGPSQEVTPLEEPRFIEDDLEEEIMEEASVSNVSEDASLISSPIPNEPFEESEVFTETYEEDYVYKKSKGNKFLYYLIPILLALIILGYTWYKNQYKEKEEIFVNADYEDSLESINDTIPFNDSSMVENVEVQYEDEKGKEIKVDEELSKSTEKMSLSVKDEDKSVVSNKTYRYEVAAGLFRSTENATKLQRKLKSAGFKAEIKLINGLRRVFVGVNTQDEAEEMSRRIEQFTGEKSVYFDENGISNR